MGFGLVLEDPAVDKLPPKPTADPKDVLPQLPAKYPVRRTGPLSRLDDSHAHLQTVLSQWVPRVSDDQRLRSLARPRRLPKVIPYVVPPPPGRKPLDDESLARLATPKSRTGSVDTASPRCASSSVDGGLSRRFDIGRLAALSKPKPVPEGYDAPLPTPRYGGGRASSATWPRMAASRPGTGRAATAPAGQSRFQAAEARIDGTIEAVIDGVQTVAGEALLHPGFYQETVVGVPSQIVAQEGESSVKNCAQATQEDAIVFSDEATQQSVFPEHSQPAQPVESSDAV